MRETVAAVEAARAGFKDPADSNEPDADADNSADSVARGDADLEPLGTGIIERDAVRTAEADEECVEGTPYSEADLRVNTTQAIHELTVSELAEIVERVVRVEGPIHRAEVSRRISSLWGQSRTGARINRSVDQALEYCCVQRRLTREDGFYSHVDQSSIPVRSRKDVASTHLRKCEFLPPAEIREAIVQVVTTHIGVKRQDVGTLTARLLGFKSTGARLRQLIEAQLNDLLAQGRIAERSGKMFG